MGIAKPRTPLPLPAEHLAQRCPNSRHGKDSSSCPIDLPGTVSCEVYEKCIFSPLHRAPGSGDSSDSL